MSSSADIAIIGGAAGGGKTFSLLLEPVRHARVPGMTSVIFRRTMPEITRPGGLWDESLKMYPLLGAESNIVDRKWYFNSQGSTLTFGSLQYEQDVVPWRGSQIALLEFDQLETFTEYQFWYMLSRNRSSCGVRPYLRASANPEPGWLADLLGWWIGDDGYAIPERSGIVRWMARKDEQVIWADTKDQLLDMGVGSDEAYSLTFILSTVYDNQKLLKADPGYLARLKLLPLVERERLLGDPKRGGNWRIKPSAGKVFNREWFEVVDSIPSGGVSCRYFDFAGTAKKSFKDDPDYTAGMLMVQVGKDWYVADLFNKQLAASQIDQVVDQLMFTDAENAILGGRRYMARWEVEPGSASLRDSSARTRRLAGIDAKGVTKHNDKLSEWRPLAAQVEQGHVKVLKAPWTEVFLSQMHGVPDLPHDDVADATSGAFKALSTQARVVKSYQG